MKGMALIYSLLLLLLLGSCKQQEQPWENEEEAMVSFTLSSPVDADSRGSVSTYPKDPSQWNENEELADGRYFKDITVMILKDNVLQAYEDFNVTDKSAQVKIPFSETFNAGTYTLMAVANYTHLNDFTTLLTEFKNGTKGYSDLMSYKLSAGDDGLMGSETIQPLTLIKEINLHPGQNQISGEMLRTYSRIRIEVRNQSDINDLVVNDISFSDNFAQKEAYIWPGQGYLPNSRVAIDVDSDDALTPFTQSVTIPKMTASGGSTTVNSAVVFDAYILESEETDANKKYSYTLDLSYGEKFATVTNTTFTNIADISKNYGNYSFLIQNVRSNKYMYDNDGSLYQGSKPSDVSKGEGANYLWKLEYAGTANNYKIRNVGTGRYIGKPASTQEAVNLTESSDDYFTFNNYGSAASNTNSSGVQMQYKDLGDYECLNDYSGNFICGYSLDDGGNPFKFYCVVESQYQNIPIFLKTINKETARPEDVRGIKRNDFINALVTVTYNETFGQFEFEVEDWNQAGGDITFN
jgi:hypothetical protein